MALTTANWVIAPPIPRARTRMARIQNSFSLNRIRRPIRASWRKVSRTISVTRLFQLLVPPRFPRVPPRGASRRNEARQRGNRAQQCNDPAVDPGIERVHLEEEVLQRGAADDAEEQCRGADTEEQADPELPRALRHDHAKNAGRVRPEGHPDPELLGALADRKAHHAVQSDGREQDRYHSEDGEERGRDAVNPEDFVMQLRRSPGEINRQVRVKGGDRLAQD